MYLHNLGENLKKEISNSKFVPHTLASELGLSVRSVWNYQKGTQTPSIPTIADISNILSISPNQLLRGCYQEQYSEKIDDLIVKLQTSEHKHMLNIIVIYFNLSPNTLARTNIGQRIRTVRIEHQMSVKQLAELVGVSDTSIVSYETNNQFPKLKHFLRLCEALEVSAEFLLFDHLHMNIETARKHIMNLTPGQVELLLKL